MNRIVRLRNGEGKWVEGKENIFRHILEHFQHLYTSEAQGNMEEVIQIIPTKITVDMNDKLLASISELENKVAVEGLGSLTAPDPYGLNGMFFS